MRNLPTSPVWPEYDKYAMEQGTKRKAAEESDSDAPKPKRVMIAPTEALFGGLSPSSLKHKASDDGDVCPSNGGKASDNTANTDVDMPDAANTDADMPDAVDTIVNLATLLPAPGSLVPASYRDKSIFPFMYLPTEIRLKIYGYLFKVNKPVFPSSRNLPAAANGRITGAFPTGVVQAMACANKRISKEVTHYIYSNNRFRLTLSYHRDWINQIGKKNASALQEIIVVGEGRVQHAGVKLLAMLTTIWKRAHLNLRFLTVHDQWFSLNSDFVVRQLLQFGAARTWNQFSKLEAINIDIPHNHAAPAADNALYEKLCFKSHARITARHKVRSVRMGFHPVRNGWYTVGDQWFQVTYEDMLKRIEMNRENKKQIALWKKKQKRMEDVEKRAKARNKAWLAKRQQEAKNASA